MESENDEKVRLIHSVTFLFGTLICCLLFCLPLLFGLPRSVVPVFVSFYNFVLFTDFVSLFNSQTFVNLREEDLEVPRLVEKGKGSSTRLGSVVMHLLQFSC